jgi:hypothetical protein
VPSFAKGHYDRAAGDELCDVIIAGCRFGGQLRHQEPPSVDFLDFRLTHWWFCH